MYASWLLSLEEASNENARYRVTLPGDLLYHYLLESQKDGASSSSSAVDEEYTRLVLLDYGVEASNIPPPITMCTFWRCEETTTDFRLDYFVQWPKWPTNAPDHEHQPSASEIRYCAHFPDMYSTNFLKNVEHAQLA